jgi:hypothetical protein
MLIKIVSPAGCARWVSLENNCKWDFKTIFVGDFIDVFFS